MCSRETMPSWGTLTGLRPGPMKTLVGSTRPHAMSCTGVRPSPGMSTGWLCVCVMKSSASPCSVHWQLRKPTISWAAPKAVRSAGQGRGFYTSALLCSALVRPPPPALWSPAQDRSIWSIGSIETSPEEGHEDDEGIRTPLLWGKALTSGEEKLWGDIIVPSKP